MMRLATVVAIFAAVSGAAHAAPIRYVPAAPGQPFSTGVRVGDTYYLSGDIGALPNGTLPPGGFAVQARQAMENIGAKLSAQGLTYDNVFKCTVMLSNMANWAEFNAVYTPYFKPDRLPARSAMAVNGLAFSAQLELECWAQFPASAETSN